MNQSSKPELENEFFQTSPFSTVADEAAAPCWSGRPKVFESLLRIKQAFERRPDSSLDVMWANLGAGKTHTLLHLRYLLQGDKGHGTHAACVFVEMPEQVRHFLDLYRRMVSALPVDILGDLILKSPAGKIPPNLHHAGNVMRHGGPAEKEIVREWLLGERPHLGELRRCSGISQRIEDDLTATDIFGGLVHCFEHSHVRLVILIDEFQRVGVLKQLSRNRVLSCLRTVFSRSPRFFSVIVAIQSMVEQSALDLIPPELRTLIGRKPSISLPEMDVDEATEFIIGRFRFYRPEGYGLGDAAPFESETIAATLHYLKEQSHIPLIPREILQAFAYVYDNATDLREGIGESEALEILQGAYGTTT